MSKARVGALRRYPLVARRNRRLTIAPGQNDTFFTIMLNGYLTGKVREDSVRQISSEKIFFGNFFLFASGLSFRR